MSAEEQPQVEAAANAGESEQPRQLSERTAKAIILLIAVGAMWGLVAAFPWIAYVVVGALGTLSWQKVAGWIGQRQGSSEETPAAEVTTEDLVETLHEVANPNVFLADFAAAFDLDTTGARAVLEQNGIRVRRAVRNGDATGVGVHKTDLPPLPYPTESGPVDGVDQGQHNQPTRPTTEPLGLAGVVVKDGSEADRSHRLPQRGRRKAS